MRDSDKKAGDASQTSGSVIGEQRDPITSQSVIN